MILLLIITTLLAGSYLNTQDMPGPELTTEYEQKLESGITAFYKADWDEARGVFEELKEVDADDPRAYFFNAMIPFWKYFFAGEPSESAEAFLEKSETALETGKKRMDEDPGDTTTVLMMGGLYGYRGLVAAGERQYRTAVRSGSSGYSYTRKLMQMSSDNPDALIGQGVFHYMVGTVPGEVRWLVNMIGLRGNKDTGFEKLEEAAQTETHTSSDARMILTYIYHEEEKFGDALRIVEPLVEQWPENIIFRYYYAMSLEKTGNKEDAREQYRTILENDHPELSVIRTKGEERLREIMASAE